MATFETAMPATVVHGEPASITEGLGGNLTADDKQIIDGLQVARLARNCPLSPATAKALAPLVFGERRS